MRSYSSGDRGNIGCPHFHVGCHSCFQIEILVHVAAREQATKIAIAGIIFHQTDSALFVVGIGYFGTYDGGKTLTLTGR